MKSLVIFDLDGTLIDVEHGAGRSVTHSFAAITADLAQARGLPLGVEDAYKYAGLSFKDRFNRVSQKFGRVFDTAELEDMHAEYQARKELIFSGPPPVMPGAAELLDRLSQDPETFTLSLASSNKSPRSIAALASTGLARHFGPRVYGADMTGGIKKPDPSIMLLAMQDYGPDRTLVVEDSIPGIQAARAAGAFAVAHLDTRMYADAAQQECRFKEAGADLVITSYDDFEQKVGAAWARWPLNAGAMKTAMGA